jgi:hypothetical protein
MKKKAIVFLLIITTVFIPVISFAASPEVVIDETILEPKDPILATVVALGPGLFVHGFGHYFTEDYKMGLLLTGMEIISIGIMGFGIVENTQPDLFEVYGVNEDQARTTGAWIFGIGLFTFLGTWLADIMMAGESAKQYNKEHNLEFKLQQESMGLGVNYAVLYKYNF